MNRKVLIIIFFSVTAVFGITLILLNVFGEQINPEIKISYCDRNPESLICTVSTPSEMAVAEDLVITVINQYNAGYDDVFCTDYFSGNITRYCSNNAIMPSSSYLLSSEVVIEQHDDGVYEVYTRYRTEHPAFVFRIGIDSIDGVYKITGLLFFEIDPNENLYLLNVQVEEFMVSMIEESQSLEEDYCETYFTGDALDSCNILILSNVPQDDVTTLVTMNEVSTNEFVYTTQTDDELTTYTFTVIFVLRDKELKISDIEFE